MIGVLFGSDVVGGPNVEKRTVTPIGEAQRLPGKAANAHIQKSTSEARAKALLVRLIEGIGRRFDRRRQADVEHLDRPLSLDEEWAGGWYGRSRSLQDALLRGSLNAGGKSKPEPKTRDDKLD